MRTFFGGAGSTLSQYPPPGRLYPGFGPGGDVEPELGPGECPLLLDESLGGVSVSGFLLKIIFHLPSSLPHYRHIITEKIYKSIAT
jgi:hypothetical protein